MIRRERRDGGGGEERGLRKGAERGYREKRQKGTELINNLKRRIRNIDTCLCLFPQGTAFLLSSRLDSAVKRCSSEVLQFSFQRSCSVKGLAEETSEVLIRSEVVGVAKVANN